MVAQPPSSARVEARPELPETFPVVLGAERFTLSLIHSQRFGTIDVRRTVTFTPTSVSAVQVWVFPADAPVVKVAEELGRCRQFSKSVTCDERAAIVALLHQDVRERLLAEVGERLGEWAVGVYDRPAAGTPETPKPLRSRRTRPEPSVTADGQAPEEINDL
ncbi:hypothetical protein ACIBHY_20705 [Nonomuraea sp. NPDC050547]|uniref:hypothetical protein n=1 Tax=Nonomuraea sp. NPDC050547 TaxID=3364368 RepID=UPI0037922748